MKTSTTLERESLDGLINMTDGHARHELMAFEVNAIHSLYEMFEESQRVSQSEVEAQFIQHLMDLARQTVPPSDSRFLNFSASTSTLLIGKIARDKHKVIWAPMPAFDNLINLLRWEGVELHSYPERIDAIMDVCGRERGSIVWLILPGNPTGFELSQEEFIAACELASRNDITLVCDFCFRFFSPLMTSFDQYALFNQSKVSFFAIEDIGKTWNTADTKVSLVSCSRDYTQELFVAHDNLLLNISPWHLVYLDRIVRGVAEIGLSTFLWDRFSAKRAKIGASFGHLPLRSASRGASAPLIWLEQDLPGGAEKFVQKCAGVNVAVLPGSQFFWDAGRKVREFVRLPLSRSDALLDEVARRIALIPRESC